MFSFGRKPTVNKSLSLYDRLDPLDPLDRRDRPGSDKTWKGELGVRGDILVDILIIGLI